MCNIDELVIHRMIERVEFIYIYSKQLPASLQCSVRSPAPNFLVLLILSYYNKNTDCVSYTNYREA